MNYETIKQLAKDQGLTVKDLIALAAQNDPFYVGTPAQIDQARWFADLWQRFNYHDGVHLRRVHYQVVSQKPAMAKPNGELYLNTENDWKYLCDAGKYARYLALVSPTAFVDRRNPDALIYAQWVNPDDFDYSDPEPSWNITRGWGEYDDNYYSLPRLPELNSLPWRLPEPPDFEAHGYTGAQQAIHLEVWAEKTTMNDVLQPLCSQYGVNLVTGAGEMSITAVVDFLARVKKADRAARILYISDFDPAGLGMPVSVARKIEFFWRNNDLDMDIRLQPIILTSEQVAQFDLPRTPVKETDRRKAAWEATQGTGAVELDALEALYPGELRGVVEEAILQYYDPDLNDRASDALNELGNLLETEHDEVMASHRDDLDAIKQDYVALKDAWRETQDRFGELVKPFEPEIEAHQERLAEITRRIKSLFSDIENELENVDVDAPEVPQPHLSPEANDVLYISERDYFDQLDAYKLHRNGSVNENDQ